MVEFKQTIGRGTRVFDGKDYLPLLIFAVLPTVFMMLTGMVILCKLRPQQANPWQHHTCTAEVTLTRMDFIHPVV